MTVYIVDDDCDFCESTKLVLQSVGLAVEPYSSANEFLSGIGPDSAGCCLLDVRMPGVSGAELFAQMVAAGIKTPAIFVTAFPEVGTAVDVLRMGAFDLLPKPVAAQTLLDCIHRAMAHDAETRRRVAELRNIQEKLATLNAGEREVIDLLVKGYSNKEMAAKLSVTRRAIEARRAKLMRKLGADSLAALIQLVIRAEQSDAPSDAHAGKTSRS